MKHELIELTEDEFDKRYPLRTNHLNPHATWAFGDARGCLFETFGEELDFVRKQHPSTVWTLVDGEDGDMYVHSGVHFVNRIGYLVSLAAVPEGVDIQVHIPMQREEVEDAEAPNEDTSSTITHTPEPWDYRPDEDGKPITNGTMPSLTWTLTSPRRTTAAHGKKKPKPTPVASSLPSTAARASAPSRGVGIVRRRGTPYKPLRTGSTRRLSCRAPTFRRGFKRHRQGHDPTGGRHDLACEPMSTAA